MAATTNLLSVEWQPLSMENKKEYFSFFEILIISMAEPDQRSLPFGQ